MASRRRSSGPSASASAAGAGRRRSAAGSAARTSRNRDARDGKTNVQCPACATAYRVPVDMVGEQIVCKSCGRAFVPKSASTRRIRQQNSATPFIMGGGVLAFMVIGYFIVTAGGQGEQQRTDTAQVPRVVETGDKNPRVRDVIEWVNALATGNRFKLAANSDLAALGKKLGVGLVNGDASAHEQAVIDALMTGETTAFLRDVEATGGLVAPEFAEAQIGQVKTYLAVRAEHADRYAQQTGEYLIDFRYRDGRGQVTGFEAFYQPPPKAKPKPPAERAVQHEILGAATNVERDYGGGEKESVREAELKPLPHLDDTPEEQRKKIDAAIATLIDLEAAGALPMRAARELKAIGKPAVPRLLNQLYELVMGSESSLTDQAVVHRIRKVTMALEDLTGQRFGFDSSAVGSTITSSEELRRSALQQWYGWWADNHWRKDFDYAIDKDVDLFGESDDKKPAPTKR